MPIVADQIGSLLFIRLDGDMSDVGHTLMDITREAVDGVAYQRRGRRGGLEQLTGVADFTTAANAAAFVTSCNALRGTVVTVILRSVSYANRLVLDCSVQTSVTMASAVGGLTGGNHLVTATFTLQKATAS